MQTTNKPSKTKIAITVVIAICIAIVIFFFGFGTFYLTLSPAQREAMWFIGNVDKHYLCYDEETGEIKSFTAEDYLEKLSELVDKYSNYYTKEEYTEVISTSKGNRYGIGLYFSLDVLVSYGGDYHVALRAVDGTENVKLALVVFVNGG